jgi:hypothetical protein
MTVLYEGALIPMFYVVCNVRYDMMHDAPAAPKTKTFIIWGRAYVYVVSTCMYVPILMI